MTMDVKWRKWFENWAWSVMELTSDSIPFLNVAHLHISHYQRLQIQFANIPSIKSFHWHELIVSSTYVHTTIELGRWRVSCDPFNHQGQNAFPSLMNWVKGWVMKGKWTFVEGKGHEIYQNATNCVNAQLSLFMLH